MHNISFTPPLRRWEALSSFSSIVLFSFCREPVQTYRFNENRSLTEPPQKQSRVISEKKKKYNLDLNTSEQSQQKKIPATLKVFAWEYTFSFADSSAQQDVFSS